MPDDLEQFLRRAAARRKARQQPVIEIVEPQTPPLVAPPPLRRPPSTEDRGVTADADFAERVSHLGESVGQADDKLELRLHQTFDHAVGSLGGTSITDDVYEASRSQPASLSIRESLQSINDLRQAIVLSEILTPAFRRW